MTNYSENELKLILEARQQERIEIWDIIDKFIRQETTEDGELLSEIKVPPQHLRAIIFARGEANDHKLETSND